MKKNILFLFIAFIICNNEVSGISQSHKLRKLGYSKHEVEQILSNKKTRRQIDYEHRLMTSGYRDSDIRLKNQTDHKYTEMKTGQSHRRVKNLCSKKKKNLTKRIFGFHVNSKKKLQQHRRIKARHIHHKVKKISSNKKNKLTKPVSALQANFKKNYSQRN